MAQLNFDATNVAQADVIEAIPAGWYNAMIDQSEMKPTKNADGMYLELRFNILDGQYVNRKVFTRLNIQNKNAQAQEISYKQLSSICHAVGVLQVADSALLHGKPLKIRVKVRPGDGEYEASNEISGFKNINENVGGAAQGGPVASGAPWANQAPAQPAFQPQMQLQQQPAFQPQMQPAQQPAPVQPAAPAWQPPAAQQPWATPGQAAPQQQPQAQPQQQPPVAQPMQQAPAEAAPAAQPGATPPWAQPQQ